MSQSLQLPIGLDPKKAEATEIAEPAKLQIPGELVVEQFQDHFRVADDLREPRRQVWDMCWDLYNGTYDWTGKEPWQAKLNIPKVRGVVDKAAGSFRRALVRMKRFYHIESETRLGVEKGYFTMSLLDYWLEQIPFIEEFSTGLKSGLITSTIVYKVWWDYVTDTEPRWEQELQRVPVMELGIQIGEQMVPTQVLSRAPKTRGQLGIKAVNPYDFWIGPRDNFRIERAVVDLSYLEELAKKGIYDKDAVEALYARSNASYEQHQRQKQKQEGQKPASKFNREVEIYHYWGDLFDDAGRVVARNVLYTVGDKDVLLRKPQVNPLMHGMDPYVVGTPYVVPFSTYNRGIVEDIAGIASMITELSNLVIDGAQFDALSAFEIDEDLLVDPRQKKRGVYPGVAFLTKGYENPSGKNVIRQITTGKIPQLAIQVLAMLDREQQLSTSVNNAMRGGEGTKSDTLGEFQAIMGSANDSLDDAARTVEETALDDLLYKSIATVYQYHEDYTLPRLVENFPKTAMSLQGMEPAERYATMLGGFQFKARGVSVMMDKAQDLEKINSLMQLISSIPGVMTRLNLDQLLENIVLGIGWNPQKLLANPGNSPVSAIQAGVPVPPPPGMAAGIGMDPSLTPAQQVAGDMGARMGGAPNNPMATQPQGGPPIG